MTAHTLKRTLRAPVGAALLGLAFLLGTSIAAWASNPAGRAAVNARNASKVSRSASSTVSLQVSAGYDGIYRGAAWTPIRVTLNNRSSGDISGTLEVPQSGQAPSVGASPTFHGLYSAPIVLPAGITKHVTVYVPGSGVQGQVDVRFLDGNRTVAAETTYPTGIDTSALLIGVMSANFGDAAWVAQSIQNRVTTHVVRLDAATLDPVPEALAAFDLIVLTNVDTSQLDRAQLGALERYVTGGGSLLLIGGPGWQETLRPLPSALLPGRIVGMRTLPNLSGLASLDPVPGSAHNQATVVSVLSHPAGTVLADQAGVPLVVRKMTGQGVIEYAAFDPALDPVRTWSRTSGMVQHLVAAAAPLAVSRTWSPQGFRLRFQRAFSSLALTGELSNVPRTTLPLLAIFALLTLVYVLILGPANFLVLRWIGRQHLAWITIPALALAYFGSTFGIAQQLKGSAVMLNSVGMVTLDGSAGPHPATMYVGLVAPLPGDYHLTYNAAALPAPLPQLNHADGFFWRSATTLQRTPLGMRLQEGTKTQITFLSMSRWAMRDLTLDTTVPVHGTVHSDLGVGAQGDIVGPIRNATNLDLLAPVIVAGQTITHLPDLTVGRTIQVHVRPGSDASSQDRASLWTRLYGGLGFGDGDGFGWFGGGSDQFSFSEETGLIDRVRNAASMLSQSRTLSSLGEVFLLGWSEQPLGTYTVDGSAPHRRDLTLVAMPLSVHFPSHGSFLLRPGTLGAHLVDIVPQAPQSNSGGFFSRRQEQVSIGPGGSVTFEFDMPNAGHVRFQRLALSINSGTEGTNAGQVYDWRARRWVAVDLSSGDTRLPGASRFVSTNGRVLVRFRPTGESGDLTIDDPYQDIQLSGQGTAT